jgi:hypothetical protein
MKNQMEIIDKWESLLNAAKKTAEGDRFFRDGLLLRDRFNNYLSLSEKVPGYGMGGQPGSEYNREVLAAKITHELGNGFGGRHLLDEKQLKILRRKLAEIVCAEPKRKRLRR